MSNKQSNINHTELAIWFKNRIFNQMIIVLNTF